MCSSMRFVLVVALLFIGATEAAIPKKSATKGGLAEYWRTTDAKQIAKDSLATLATYEVLTLGWM